MSKEELKFSESGNFLDYKKTQCRDSKQRIQKHNLFEKVKRTTCV